MESRSTTDNWFSAVLTCQPIKIEDSCNKFRVYLDYNVPLPFSFLSLLVFLNKKQNKTKLAM